jgi:phytol kinase
VNPWAGIALVLGALGFLIGVVRLAQGRIAPELSRKAVHVGMGALCLAFPWIFRETWPVVLLALLAMAFLAALRGVPLLRRTLGGVLGGVERQSLGEFYFPAAVAAVFWLADGHTLLFVIPVLTLTVADSVGALIGVRYGFSRYQTDEGLKSTEGSVAFFTTAFLSCHIPLLLFSDIGRAECLLISLTAGFVVMLLEAISWRGQDNLIIPLGMAFLLRLYLPLDAAALLARLVVLTGLVALVLFWRRRTTLSDSAVLAGALAGFALWAFGGWPWLLPPVLLFLVYVSLPTFPAETRPRQNLHAVTRVMAGGFFWLVLDEQTDRDLLGVYGLCLAAHTGNIISARLRVVRAHLPLPQILGIAWGVASLVFGLLAVGLAASGWVSWVMVALTPLAVGLSVPVFAALWPVEHRPDQRVRIWFSETVIAVLASAVGLWR